MRQTRTDLLLNTTKVFRLKDIFFPESDDVMNRTTPDLKLRGRIIDFSDSGGSKKEYAIIQVEGIDGPVIVPVEKLQAVWQDDDEENKNF